MQNYKWEEIKKDLKLNGVSEVYFWKSNWEKFDPLDPSTPVSYWYIMYRFIYMIFFIVGLFQGTCASFFMGRYYFIYLTIQTFLLQVIYSVCSFFYILFVFTKKRRVPPINEEVAADAFTTITPVTECCKRLPIQCKVIWVMMSIVQVFPAIVSLGFWFVIVPAHGINDIDGIGMCEHIHNLTVHLFNFILAMTDAFVVSVPSRVVHSAFVVGYALYYAFFSVCYEIWNGNYPNGRDFIYSVLNWRRKPLLAVVTTILAVVMSIVFFIIFSYGVYKLKFLLRKKHVLGIHVEESRQTISPDISEMTNFDITEDDVTILPRIPEPSNPRIQA